VRVNAVSPGPTNTPGTEAQGDGFAAIVSTIPLGRAAAPEGDRGDDRLPRLRQDELPERSGHSRRRRPGRSLTPLMKSPAVSFARLF
jgi:NAD(P)-dependent dehydrogenase (short-subunit alcohol dehydrogenase family)